MALNVSVVLRANADQLEGELGEAKAAIRGLGTEAKSAGGAMSSGLSQGTGVLDRLRGLATTVRGSFRTARGAIAQLGMQAQDVAVGLASGQSPFTVLAQQGSQIASLFGPGGAIVGAVLAAGALLTGLFLNIGDGLSAAERAASSFKAAMEGVNDTVGKGVVAADKLVNAYAGASAEMRRLGMLDLERATRRATEAHAAQRSELREMLKAIEAASRGSDANFFSRLNDPGAGVRAAAGRFRAGGMSDAELIAELGALSGSASGELQELIDKALDSAIAAAELRAQLEQLGQARSSLEGLAAGAEAELGGRLTDQLRGVQGEVEATTGAFERMYQDVDLWMFGTVNDGPARRLLVKAIEPGPDLSAPLVCVDEAAAVHSASDGPIPPFDSRISLPPGTARPLILSVRSDETVLLRSRSGTLRPRILIALFNDGSRPITQISGIRTRWRVVAGGDEGWSRRTDPADASEISLEEVEEGERYELQLRFVYHDGRLGRWSARHTHTVVGLSTRPPDDEDMTIDRLQLYWRYPEPPPDLLGFEVRLLPGWDWTAAGWPKARPAHVGLLGGPPQSLAGVPPGQWTALVKGVDAGGNRSRTAALALFAVAEPLEDDIIETIDLAAAGWPGELSGARWWRASSWPTTARCTCLTWRGSISRTRMPTTCRSRPRRWSGRWRSICPTTCRAATWCGCRRRSRASGRSNGRRRPRWWRWAIGRGPGPARWWRARIRG